jgi:hypothetical protein
MKRRRICCEFVIAVPSFCLQIDIVMFFSQKILLFPPSSEGKIGIVFLFMGIEYSIVIKID